MLLSQSALISFTTKMSVNAQDNVHLFCTMCIEIEIAPAPDTNLLPLLKKQIVLRDTQEHQFPISPTVQRLICSVALNSH